MKSIRRYKITLSSVVLVAVLSLAVIVVSNNSIGETSGISNACRNSPDCMAAVEKERQANAAASSANQNANLYEAKVNELNAEIARTESEIAETEAEIKELNQKIAEEEEKLNTQQDALAKLFVEMHFSTTSDTITILASSESISDLAEKQSREQVVKSQISAAVSTIEETKKALEEDKASVEAMLETQKIARKNLAEKRAEQQALVEKYKNDANAYASAAKAAREAQEAAERAEQEAHPERYSGSQFSGVNTYPWQNDCPGRKDAYGTYWNGNYIGGYVCECVSYVGWKAYEAFGVYLAWGNAYSWDDRARSLLSQHKIVTAVNNTPAADAIGQTDSGKWGHVFWVESVNANGSINVTEYNNYYATQLYSGIYRSGDFGARTISASAAKQYTYIHFE